MWEMVCVGQPSGLAQSIAAPRAAIPLRQAARISRQVVRAQRSAPCQQEQASTSQRCLVFPQLDTCQLGQHQ